MRNRPRTILVLRHQRASGRALDLFLKQGLVGEGPEDLAIPVQFPGAADATCHAADRRGLPRPGSEAGPSSIEFDVFRLTRKRAPELSFHGAFSGGPTAGRGVIAGH